MDPKPNDWYLYKKRTRRTETQGRRPFDHGGRSWSDAATTQRTPMSTRNHQKLGERHGTSSTLTSDCWPPKPQENQFLLLLATQL